MDRVILWPFQEAFGSQEMFSPANPANQLSAWPADCLPELFAWPDLHFTHSFLLQAAPKLITHSWRVSYYSTGHHVSPALVFSKGYAKNKGSIKVEPTLVFASLTLLHSADKRKKYIQAINKMKHILEHDRKALKYGGAWAWV